jgi:hypothetical protein
VPGQSPDQQVNLFFDASAFRCKRAKRQTPAQLLRASRRTCAELPKTHRIAAEAGDDVSIRARLERDVSAEPGR